MSVYLRTACLASLFVACVTDPVDSPDPLDQGEGEVEQEAAAPPVGRCSGWACGQGGNSPKIDHMGTHDLSTQPNERNASGFRLVEIEKSARSYTMKVIGASVILTDRNGGPTLTGTNVTGAVLTVINDLTGTKYVIKIVDAGTATYWGRPGGFAKTTPTYQLEWAVAGQINPEWENICESPPSDTGFNMNRFHAVLFEGDRIDARTKAVSKQIQPQWFNIGCANHALAKWHLNGYTFAAQQQTAADLPVASRFTSAWYERQAYVRLITGDYCGGGEAITMAGQPLGSFDPPKAYRPTISDALEARWDETGAVCLNTPRIDANKTPEGIALFGGKVEQEIKDACARRGRARPPACTGTSLTPTTLPWVSTNPPPLP